MKQFVLSLVVLGLPFWLPDNRPSALARAELIVAQPVATSPDQKPSVIVLANAVAEGEQRGWLGVSISEVPEALAAQMDVPESGVLIVNVLKDSPAERAGIEVHDIVLSLDGQAVDHETMTLAELIGSRKPGDKVNVALLRQGQKKNVSIELGSRPSSDNMVWKFDITPHTKVEERVRTRGKIMGKGPGGQWFIKDLGELENLKNLGDQFKVMVPHSGSQSTKVFVDGNRKTFNLNVNDDGSSININQDDDGEITVTRIDASGNTTEATYENEDQLKAADAEAYEMLSGTGKGAFFQMHLDALGQHGDVTVELGEWQEKLQEGLKEAHEAMQNAHVEMEKVHREMAEKLHGAQPSHDGRSEPQGRVFKFQPGDGGTPFVASMLGKPKQSFSVQANGTIEVRIRKGDTEVVRNFSSEADLAKRDPKLYEKYQDVMEGEE